METTKRNKKVFFLIVILLIVLIVVIGTTYALFTQTASGERNYVINAGDLQVLLDEDKTLNDIISDNAVPISDSNGKQTESYNFSLVNQENTALSYSIYIVEDTTSNKTPSNDIKYFLTRDYGDVEKLSLLSDVNDSSKKLIETGEIPKYSKFSYTLRMWISKDAGNEILGTTFSCHIEVVAEQIISNEKKPLIENISVDEYGEITADISDETGLNSYAITQSSIAPELTSTDWILIDDTSLSKTITYYAEDVGTYYIYVRNSLDVIETNFTVIESINKTPIPAKPGVVTDSLKEYALTRWGLRELRIDEHEATGNQTFASTEYRYYGANPSNYVLFNKELWRIIGIMTVENSLGELEERVKIIRNESLGKYSWDSSASTVNNGYGVNEWSQADLMKLLNETYYNSGFSTCYNGSKNKYIYCSFYSNGLSSDAASMISDVKWYTAATNFLGTEMVDRFYNAERGTVGKLCTASDPDWGWLGNCTDTVERKQTWIGKIGLMYISDYGYAADMSLCSNIGLSSYFNGCYTSDWLFSNDTEWTLTPYATIIDGSSNFVTYNSGNVSASSCYYDNIVRPTVYLTSDVIIASGAGTSEDPFILTK